MTDCAAPRHPEPVPAEPHSHLCHDCRTSLRRHLRQLPELHAALLDLYGLPGISEGGDGDALPYNDKLYEYHTQIGRDAEVWVKWVTDTWKPSAWPVRTVPAMCGWLTGWVNRVSHRDWAPLMAGAFAADHGHAIALLYPRPVEQFPLPPGCGYCPSCGADSTLLAVIHQDPGDPRPSTISCGCGHVWDAAPWLRVLYAAQDRQAAA